jgi:uncharacterized cupin superfamily protein
VNLLRETGRIGERLGAEEWGCTVYELEPGGASPYHWHVGEEEWLLVLAGTPTLRTPAGEEALRPWDLSVFPRGEAGAHQLRNDSGQAVRVAFFSTKSDPEVAVYPDDGKIGVVAGDIRGWVVPR